VAGRIGSQAERTTGCIREMGHQNISRRHFSVFREPASLSEMHVRLTSQVCEFVMPKTHLHSGARRSSTEPIMLSKEYFETALTLLRMGEGSTPQQ
jgi:hypothetical protein